MAVSNVTLGIELAIELYKTLVSHPGTVPFLLWELRTKIHEAAHAIIGPLSEDYTNEIIDILAVHPHDQAQEHLDNGASDEEVAATWWLLYRGHLDADHS